jgi:hypothetical protein
MHNKFSSDNVRTLLERALRQPTSDIVSLTIKAAREANVSLLEVGYPILKRSGFHAEKMGTLLLAITKYEGLGFVLEALQHEHIIIQKAAVAALQRLNDERSLSALNNQWC